MAVSRIIPIALALGLSAAHFFGEKYAQKLEKWHYGLTSFSAGLFLAILVTDLLPMFVYSKSAHYLLFAGIAGYHLAEKYVYQHTLPSEERQKMGLAHAAGFFLDNFFDGVLLVLLFSISEAGAFLVFVPLLLHKLSSTLLLSHLLENVKKIKHGRLAFSASTFFGAIAAVALDLPQKSEIIEPAFALLLGTLIYLAIRDMIPGGRKEKLAHFTAGAMLGLAATLIV